jgi:hypothetical protein
MNKQIVIIVVLMMVTLVFSNTVTVSMSFRYEDLSTEEKEKWVKKYLDMGDTISETLSGVSVTEEDRKKSKYLSDLYEEMLETQKKDREEREEKEDKFTERDIAVMCGASEDYERNEDQCKKLYKMLREGEIPDDPDYEYK